MHRFLKPTVGFYRRVFGVRGCLKSHAVAVLGEGQRCALGRRQALPAGATRRPRGEKGGQVPGDPCCGPRGGLSEVATFRGLGGRRAVSLGTRAGMRWEGEMAGAAEPVPTVGTVCAQETRGRGRGLAFTPAMNCAREPAPSTAHGTPTGGRSLVPLSSCWPDSEGN